MYNRQNEMPQKSKRNVQFFFLLVEYRRAAGKGVRRLHHKERDSYFLTMEEKRVGRGGACKGTGRKKGDVFMKTVTFYLAPDTIELLAQLAKRRGKTRGRVRNDARMPEIGARLSKHTASSLRTGLRKTVPRIFGQTR
jgi:hypothetical protein